MASGNAILAGILGGLGGAGQAIGGGFAQAQKDELERERLAQERDLRQQALDAQVAQMAQQQSQFEATKAQQQSQFEAGRFTDLPVSALPASYAGGQPDANGNVRVQTSLLPALTKMREDEVTQGRYGALADYLRGRRGSPATADAAMSPEGAMYSEQEVLPGAPAVAARPVDPNDLVGLLAGIPGGAELARVILPASTQKFGIHGGNAAGSPTVIYNQQTGEPSQIIPGVEKPQFKVETVDRPEGTFKITTNILTGETTAEKIPGVPGKPAFAPQRPEQPNAATQYVTIMQQAQQARDTYGEEDPRTKNLFAIALGLRSQVDPQSGTRIEAPKAVDPVKAAIAAMMANKPAPGPGITPPGRGTTPPALVPAKPEPPPPFPDAIRIIRRDGMKGWRKPSEPLPPGAMDLR